MSVAILLVVFAVLAVIAGVTMPWIGESLYESEDEIDAMLEEKERQYKLEREWERKWERGERPWEGEDE